jgi:hypothetical protein
LYPHLGLEYTATTQLLLIEFNKRNIIKCLEG